ncbi:MULTISPECIES: acyl carrier protein [unclassified Janthinobacterium]|jgi:acyl carrier protein|uniref:acyl carrier protein n=1 Tax=unclassified Janthinobacterium TaxID=2610881 RepID=UPI00161081D8|nr:MULTISPECIES: acyl carrier protein [unclassified Janthinobacterium]MBB5606529.1 acyl carrier protein [Janthinobacterium sp. S3T4]MBB5611599.1 acyl carrier protein [Janthinobacterium sp. S3M3]
MPHPETINDTVSTAVQQLLCLTLGLGTRPLTAETPLLGSLPELDSMAVISVIAALEGQFGFEVADDEIHARHFATVGSLSDFVRARLMT